LNRRLPPVAPPYQFAIMMLTVSAVFDIIHHVTGLLTEQTHHLSTSDMEVLLTSGLITLHASTHAGLEFLLIPPLLTNVAGLVESLLGDEGNEDLLLKV